MPLRQPRERPPRVGPQAQRDEEVGRREGVGEGERGEDGELGGTAAVPPPALLPRRKQRRQALLPSVLRTSRPGAPVPTQKASPKLFI